VYALIVLDVLMTWGKKWTHAALLVREPAIRNRDSDVALGNTREWEIAIEAEISMRSRGLTSCFEAPFEITQNGELVEVHPVFREHEANHQYAANFARLSGLPIPYKANRLNVQVCKSALEPDRYIVVDLGHIRDESQLPSRDLMNLAHERPYMFGGIIPEAVFANLSSSKNATSIAADFDSVSCDKELQSYFRHFIDEDRNKVYSWRHGLMREYEIFRKDGDSAPLIEFISKAVERWSQ
jgi:hypothetical protein